VRRRLLLAMVAVALVLVPAAPASAHGGPLKLDVSGDGADGVVVRATFEDGHPAEPTIRLVLVAVGEGGRSVGPVQLTQSGEGRGFYNSGSMLAPGRWQIVVSAPEPNSARTEITYEARAPQTPLPVERVSPPASDDGGTWLWLALGLVAVAGAAFVGFLVMRRRVGAGSRHG
jgi:hypothetical protein